MVLVTSAVRVGDCLLRAGDHESTGMANLGRRRVAWASLFVWHANQVAHFYNRSGLPFDQAASRNSAFLRGGGEAGRTTEISEREGCAASQVVPRAPNHHSHRSSSSSFRCLRTEQRDGPKNRAVPVELLHGMEARICH